MSPCIIYFILLLGPALSRNVPKYTNLDEDDHMLLRAAYETPSYDHDEEENDLEVGKIDLKADALWAVKAKLKELKVIDKALKANLLATKLSVKELLKHELGKKHLVMEHEKPYSYPSHASSYQAPVYKAPPSYSPPSAPPSYQAPSYQTPPQYLPYQQHYDPYYGQ